MSTGFRVLSRWLAASQPVVIRPEGWTASNDVPNGWTRPGHLYRGMDEKEWRAHQHAGYIQSSGAYSHASEGTNFADDAADAESYANYGRTDPRKTGRPTYLIEVKKDSELIPRASDGYYKATGPVPLDKVTRAWKMEADGDTVIAIEVHI